MWLQPQNVRHAQSEVRELASGWGFAAKLPSVEQLLQSDTQANDATGLSKCVKCKPIVKASFEGNVCMQNTLQHYMAAEHSIVLNVLMLWLRPIKCSQQ